MELPNKLWNIHLMQDHAAKGMSKQVNTQNMANVEQLHIRDVVKIK